MNAVATPPKAKSVKDQASKPPAPASPIWGPLDDLVLSVAQQIAPLTIIYIDYWPDDYPAKEHLREADGLLAELSQPLEDWVADTVGPPRSATGGMLDSLVANLRAAQVGIDSDRDFAPGRRRVLALLTGEALHQSERLLDAYKEACLGRVANLKAMAGDSSGAVLTKSNPGIEAESKLTEVGQAAIKAVIKCSYDIETISQQVTLLGDECDYEGCSEVGVLLRCYGTRIEALNSNIMSFLGDDGQITMGDVHHTVYGRAKPFKGSDYV